MWQTFLASRPGQGLEPDIPSDITAAAICDLSHLGLLRVSGEDAADFLQGQLTNDVTQLTDSHSHLSAYCTPKGRVLALFRALRRDDAFILQLPREILAPIQKRLGMFVLMAKVTLEDVSDELAHFGIIGTDSIQRLENHFATLPNEENTVVHQKDLTLIRHPGAIPRYQVIGPIETVQSLWLALEGETSRVSAQTWSLLDIRAGIPHVYLNTQESFIPQMLNLDAIDGVSFTKGCYVGQEVVARMHYLGKQKRFMYRATVETDQALQAGDRLFSPSSRSEQGAGTVVDLQHVNSGYELLVVLENDAAETNDVRVSENGPTLEIKNVPYPILDGDSQQGAE